MVKTRDVKMINDIATKKGYFPTEAALSKIETGLANAKEALEYDREIANSDGIPSICKENAKINIIIALKSLSLTIDEAFKAPTH